MDRKPPNKRRCYKKSQNQMKIILSYPPKMQIDLFWVTYKETPNITYNKQFNKVSYQEKKERLTKQVMGGWYRRIDWNDYNRSNKSFKKNCLDVLDSWCHLIFSYWREEKMMIMHHKIYKGKSNRQFSNYFSSANKC